MSFTLKIILPKRTTKPVTKKRNQSELEYKLNNKKRILKEIKQEKLNNNLLNLQMKKET